MDFIALALVLLVSLSLALDPDIQDGLALQNEYRAKHNAPGLALDQRLIELAQQCADYYADIDRVDHTCPYKEKLGENLGWEKNSRRPPPPKKAIPTSVNGWYEEIKDYDFEDPAKSKDITGHLTQLLWKSSERVGMATAASPLTNITYVAALYDPPGNVAVKSENDAKKYKLYLKNVLKPVESKAAK